MSLREAPPRDRTNGPSVVWEQEIEHRIVGRSAALQRVRQRALALCSLRLPLLLRGEAGTGRRHIARVLHALAGSGRELVVVSAREPLSRAPEARRAYFLEEVTQLPRAEQARWSELALRVEQGRADAPLRIFAASAFDLARLARSGDFDAAFAGRLLRFSLDLPPLRERSEDVPDLARWLADRAADRIGRARVALTAPALRQLASQSWPGNVRELAAVVERLVAFCSGERIGRADVLAVLDEAPLGVVSSRRLRHRRQREELIALIDEAGGNLAEVARRLEMSRGGVIYHAQKFGLLPKRAG
jgi:DNA-binding NtrC family response regulator